MSELAKRAKRLAEDIQKFSTEKADPDTGLLKGDDIAEFKAMATELEQVRDQMEAAGLAKDILSTVTAPVEPVVHNAEAEKVKKSLTEQLLGPRSEWKGIDANSRWSASATVPNLKTVFGHTAGGVLVEPDFTGQVEPLGQRTLTIADVFGQGTTGSDLVQFVRQTTRTNNADWVSEAGNLTGNVTKPESAAAYELVSEAVGVVAHWIPVTNQMLADYGQTQSLIETDLLYGLGYVKDRDLLWGSGSNNEITGLMNTTNVQAHTRVATDTVVDTIRRMITKSYTGSAEGYVPDFCGMSPIVKEAIDLNKETTNAYIVMMINGRVWGLPVVESPAFEDPSNAGDQYIVVGCGKLGAMIWEREQANVTVGLVDKQFIQNTKTLLAEERLAFGVKRPYGFVYTKIEEDANGFIS